MRISLGEESMLLIGTALNAILTPPKNPFKYWLMGPETIGLAHSQPV